MLARHHHFRYDAPIGREFADVFVQSGSPQMKIEGLGTMDYPTLTRCSAVADVLIYGSAIFAVRGS